MQQTSETCKFYRKGKFVIVLYNAVKSSLRVIALKVTEIDRKKKHFKMRNQKVTVIKSNNNIKGGLSIS